MEGTTPFYSKDGFWWNGAWPENWVGTIDIYEKDAHINRLDINNRPLFVSDIIEVTFNRIFKKKRLFEVIEYNDQLALRRFPAGEVMPLSHLDQYKRVEWRSFSFLQSS
ncbi:MAG: hypothetical protein HRT74_03865 [Flavobacteriales bacterium]|nr:hypothetical protein [Flavobacteriales bacterium]